ncbi:MAG TPA: S-layer homology domain-containing protein [Anaerolineae bacterium]|nr:S-layer homology domain-containing protein [Anaerolineae bacterium]
MVLAKRRLFQSTCLFLILVTLFVLGPTGPTLAQEQPVRVLPTNQKVVALTFDGTFSRGSIDEIIRILNDEDVTATFFLAGTFIDNFPSDAIRIRDNCFALGNHSNTHPDLVRLTDQQIINEANTARQKFLDVLGIETRPFFRVPYGSYDNRVLTALNQAGYTKIIQWDIDTIDWREDTTVQDIVRRVERGLEPGSIILMHVAGARTAEALPEVIRFIKSQGYTFTDIPRFYGMPQPQQHVPGLVDVLCFNWYFDPIRDLVAEGVVAGYPNGTFKPLATINRAEFVKLVVEAEDIPPATTFTGTFPDVPQTYWAWPYIEAAAERGLISGYPDGTFRPLAPVERQEIAKIIVLAEGYPISTSGPRFADVPASLWSFQYIMTARNNGAITGYPDGTFKPAQPTNRAEAAAVVWRVTR